MFYTAGVRVEYREEPCRSALNRVKGMPFEWSLNPYMGCVHRCTFCYVRAFERRADRPSDDRYGRSIRVKINVAEVLRARAGAPSWEGRVGRVGAATDPYQPAEGRYRLTRGCLEAFAEASNPFCIITRGPMIVRDLDVLAEARASREGLGHVLGADARRGGLAQDRARHGAPAPAAAGAKELVDAGIKVGRRAWRRSCRGSRPTGPSSSRRSCSAAREAGACGIWANLLYLRPGTREHFLDSLARDWPEELDRYERLYDGRAYLGAEHTKPTCSGCGSRRSTASDRGASGWPEPPVVAEQLALASRAQSAAVQHHATRSQLALRAH